LVAHLDVPPDQEVEQLAISPKLFQLERRPAMAGLDADDSGFAHWRSDDRTHKKASLFFAGGEEFILSTDGVTFRGRSPPRLRMKGVAPCSANEILRCLP